MKNSGIWVKPVSPKGNQPWIFIGRADAEAEAPILWPRDAKSQFTGKDPDAGKDWRQEEKGVTEDQMVGWHHWLNGHEFEKTPGDSDWTTGIRARQLCPETTDGASCKTLFPHLSIKLCDPQFMRMNFTGGHRSTTSPGSLIETQNHRLQTIPTEFWGVFQQALQVTFIHAGFWELLSRPVLSNRNRMRVAYTI